MGGELCEADPRGGEFCATDPTGGELWVADPVEESSVRQTQEVGVLCYRLNRGRTLWADPGGGESVLQTQ